MTWKRKEGNVTPENPENVANLLNNYLQSMLNPPLSQKEYDNHPSSTTSSYDMLTDIHVTSDDVRRILSSLDVNKAMGPDKIPARLLRCCAPYISSSLSYLFDQ